MNTRIMKLKTLLITLFLAVLIANASAVNDTIILNSEIYAEKISADLDSLVNSWYVRMAMKNYPEDFNNDSVGVAFSDSVYVERINKINSLVKLRYNSIIRNHIQVYTIKQRKHFSAVLGLMNYYFPMIEDIFDSYGLPSELKYMSVIESALNPNAFNRHSGATGMWQFMYSTGRMYGLNINSIVDERRDPVKATHAAAKYISDLYKIYNDWILVIAAYNCGPGNVNKAIKRSGNKKDYWDIYYRLPRETRGYIPQYVAAAYAINYFAEEKIRPLPLNIPVSTDTIMVTKDIHLNQISEVMGIPLGELRALNPQYRTGLVPGSTKPLSLTLPMSHLGDFIDLNDTIRNYKADLYLSRINLTSDPSRSAYIPVDVKGKTKLLYTVKDGDNLGFISEWYRVGLSDLRYWNNIYRNTIRVGQKLAIYVDPSKSDNYSRINAMTFAEKQQIIGRTVTPNPVETALLSLPDGDYVTYTVRYGDTIWDIVKMFDNVSATDVLTLNSISDPGKIKVGQILKIKKKS
jgi:membrane-bound lytic murein transglycosylase D